MHEILLEAALADSKALVQASEEEGEQGLKQTSSINYSVVHSPVEVEELAEGSHKAPEAMTYSRAWA